MNWLRALLLGRSRALMLIAGVLVALLVVGSALLDEGEVVRLEITDGEGRQHETDLWIVDFDDQLWLRAAQPDAIWLAWLRAHPRVVLSRDGSEFTFDAVPEESATIRDRVGSEMARKYGFADRFWSHISDRSHAVPIRLVPVEPSTGELVGNDRNTD